MESVNTTIQIETKIRDYLVSNNIYPFSVLYIPSESILKISFFLQDDIQDFLKLSGYKEICDNSGFIVFEDTVLLSGIGLSNFLRNVNN